MGRRADWEQLAPGTLRLIHIPDRIQRNRQRGQRKRSGENDESPEWVRSKPYGLS
jgi:hypothetical protein